MGNAVDPKLVKSINKDDIVFPEEVRKILNVDNEEIKRLCKTINICPKKDNNTGRTFFLKNDVEAIKRVQELHLKGQKIAQDKNIVEAKEPLKTIENPITAPNQTASLESEFKKVVENLVMSQDSVVDRLSKILDEKLDGLDEVIVELIRSKTENENLRSKLNELTKENYKLKKENATFVSLGLGLYIKKSDD